VRRSFLFLLFVSVAGSAPAQESQLHADFAVRRSD